jgi:hypothetical protein
LYVDLPVKAPVNHIQLDVYVRFCYKILLVYLIIVNEWIPLLGRRIYTFSSACPAYKRFRILETIFVNNNHFVALMSQILRGRVEADTR